MKNKLSVILTIAFVITVTGYVSVRALLSTPRAEITQPSTNEITYNYDNLVPEKMVHIKNTADVEILRKRLITFIFGQDTLPYEQLPSKVELRIWDAAKDQKDSFTESNYLSHIDRLTVDMGYGIDSRLYIYHPTDLTKEGSLIIYHHGHGYADDYKVEPEIDYFLSQGYPVLAVTMPVDGTVNRAPIQLPDKTGKLFAINTHNDLRNVDSSTVNPTKLFFMATTVGINYAKSNKYQNIYMVGHSGGGWTTSLYAGLDERINKSFSISGGLPKYLDELISGDYETSLPELFKIANYLDFYILSSFGKGRAFVQTFNKNDPCCSAVFTRHLAYETTIKSLLTSLGSGSFGVYIDNGEPSHRPSKNVLEFISKIVEDESTLNTLNKVDPKEIFNSSLRGLKKIDAYPGDTLDLAYSTIKVIGINKTADENGLLTIELTLEVKPKNNVSIYVDRTSLSLSYKDTKGEYHLATAKEDISGKELASDKFTRGHFYFYVPSTTRDLNVYFYTAASAQTFVLTL